MHPDTETDSSHRTAKRVKSKHASALPVCFGEDNPEIITGFSAGSPPPNSATKYNHNTARPSAVNESASCRKKLPLSCGECRRLKLKCDRVFPCRACVKRGCEGICPEGSLVSGRGSRYILANTERLHEKIVQMSDRIRELENALCITHAQHCLCTGETINSHPLLQGSRLLVKTHLELYGIGPSLLTQDSESPTPTDPSSALSGTSAESDMPILNSVSDSSKRKDNKHPLTYVEGSRNISFSSDISQAPNINDALVNNSKSCVNTETDDTPQASVDLASPSHCGETGSSDASSFGCLGHFLGESSAGAGINTLPPAAPMPRNTDFTQTSSDANVSMPAVTLDHCIVAWLTQFWLSRMANSEAQGPNHSHITNSNDMPVNFPCFPSVLNPTLFLGGEAAAGVASASQYPASQYLGDCQFP